MQNFGAIATFRLPGRLGGCIEILKKINFDIFILIAVL
jgi:hypothetical protein